MKRRAFLAGTAATLAAPALRAQAAWPNGQPIRVIVPYPPGAANDAMGRLAAPSHLATVDFMARTGVTIATTPYRGTAPALTDVVGGHVQLLIDASFALLPAAGEGRVKALGITTKERSTLAPDLPTLAEQGLDGFDFQSWYGLWAPKGTPQEICQRINTLMRETMQEPAIVQRLNSSLLEPVIETI